MMEGKGSSIVGGAIAKAITNWRFYKKPNIEFEYMRANRARNIFGKVFQSKYLRWVKIEPKKTTRYDYNLPF